MECMIATRNRPWTCLFFWHSIQFDPLVAQGCVMENACPAWVELALLWTLSYKSIHSDAIAWFSLCLWGQVLESLSMNTWPLSSSSPSSATAPRRILLISSHPLSSSQVLNPSPPLQTLDPTVKLTIIIKHIWHTNFIIVSYNLS